MVLDILLFKVIQELILMGLGMFVFRNNTGANLMDLDNYALQSNTGLNSNGFGYFVTSK